MAAVKAKKEEAESTGVKKRKDGFYEVAGAAGYFDKATAERVARQLAEAKKQAAPDDSNDVDGEDEDEDEGEEPTTPPAK